MGAFRCFCTRRRSDVGVDPERQRGISGTTALFMTSSRATARDLWNDRAVSTLSRATARDFRNDRAVMNFIPSESEGSPERARSRELYPERQRGISGTTALFMTSSRATARDLW